MMDQQLDWLGSFLQAARISSPLSAKTIKDGERLSSSQGCAYQIHQIVQKFNVPFDCTAKIASLIGPHEDEGLQALSFQRCSPKQQQRIFLSLAQRMGLKNIQHSAMGMRMTVHPHDGWDGRCGAYALARSIDGFRSSAYIAHACPFDRLFAQLLFYAINVAYLLPTILPYGGHGGLMSLVVRQRGQYLAMATPDLQAHPLLVRLAVQQNGLALRYAGDVLRDDSEVVLMAVQQNPSSFRFASRRLRSHRDFVRVLLEQYPAVFPWIGSALLQDKQLALIVVGREGSMYLQLPSNLQKDADIALAAVKQDYRMFPLLCMSHRADENIVLAAVRQHGLLLYFANDTLRTTRKIVEIACLQNPSAWRFGGWWSRLILLGKALLYPCFGDRLFEQMDG